jgi:hypothetical protein
MALAIWALACSDGPTAPGETSRGLAPTADSRLDLADDNVEKAILLLQASQNPNAKNPDRAFGGHRTKALSLLERARQEITAAKAYADDPKNQAFLSP